MPTAHNDSDMAQSALLPRAAPEAPFRPAADRLARLVLLCWATTATAWAVAAGPLWQLARDTGRGGAALRAEPLAGIQAVALRPGAGDYHRLYAESLRGAKHIDLTHALSPDIPVWPGFGAAVFGPAEAGHTMGSFVKEGQEFSYGKHGFIATRYVLTTDQYGTQLDPPAHWNEYGATISDLPPTFALRPLVVLDVHDKVATNASYHATVADAKAWEKVHGRIPEGSVVMVRSDWSQSWERFTSHGLPEKYPGVTLDLLKFLHLQRKILFHGHEPLDTDMTPTLEGEAWLMHKNFAQAEGVANLDQVPEHGCLLSIGYAKFRGGTGGYARYIAICPPSWPHGVSAEEVPGAPLPESQHPLRRVGGVLIPAEGEPTEYCRTAGALGCTAKGPVWG